MPLSSNYYAALIGDDSDSENEEEERLVSTGIEEAISILRIIMGKEDIWISVIFPFVGAGRFIFMDGVNKSFRENYRKFALALEDPPLVKAPTEQDPDASRPATNTDTFYSAALETVPCAEYWVEHQGDTTLACTQAAIIGNLPVLQWAREQDFPWDASTCASAAKNGHLKVLKWAHENGCPWDRETCNAAAAAGHLKVLQWAHNNRCPWDWQDCIRANGYGHLDVLQRAINIRDRRVDRRREVNRAARERMNPERDIERDHERVRERRILDQRLFRDRRRAAREQQG